MKFGSKKKEKRPFEEARIELIAEAIEFAEIVIEQGEAEAIEREIKRGNPEKT